jgi:hypothetical protein
MRNTFAEEVAVAPGLADAAFPSKDAKGTMYDGIFLRSELWHEAAYEVLGGGVCDKLILGFIRL